MGTKKIAISMPEPMYREMERARHRARKDRSVWVQEAVEERLRREKKEADIAAYIRGYERFPETPEEIEVVRETALDFFTWLEQVDPWEE